jgi:hypothetical protein
MSRYAKTLLEVIGLQTARGRLLFFVVASVIIFILPTKVLGGFSIWQRLDIPSPSIGLTRAYHYILHGDLERAWQQNSLIFVVLLIGLPLLTKDVYNVVKQLNTRSDHGRSE